MKRKVKRDPNVGAGMITLSVTLPASKISTFLNNPTNIGTVMQALGQMKVSLEQEERLKKARKKRKKA